MNLPVRKTKIVCTIGPASRTPAMIESMIKEGMNVVRLNFSHGSFEEHGENIRNIKRAAAKLKCPLTIIVDLPGVKMRLGKLKGGRDVLKKGDRVTLTTKNVLGNASLMSVSYRKLPQSVTKGGIIYLFDGFIQLRVEDVKGTEINCRVVIGGPIFSHKGINLPGAKLAVEPITAQDLRAIDFCLKNGVNTFGLSFVERARDINKVREFARRRGKNVYLVAKIERREAIVNFDEILRAADAVMIARGDLGIEIPIEEVPVIQKELIRKANIAGRPVITATQMLGSMTQNVRPTRAEVNDVANAIVDGTDAVMLSEETAVGEYPLSAINMMSRIAVSTEHLCHTQQYLDEVREQIRFMRGANPPKITDVISVNVVRAASKLRARFIITQTTSGSTARNISRFKPNCWTLSFSDRPEVYDFLNFSYGVYPFLSKDRKTDHILKTIRRSKIVARGDTVVLTERRFSNHSGRTDSMAVITLE